MASTAHQIQTLREEPLPTQRMLLETAIRLIWQSSYHRVGVNEICQQAGVTKGCFYHHFASKAELFREAAALYWAEVEASLQTMFSPEISPIERLASVARYVIELQEQTPGDGNAVSGCPFFTAGSVAEPDEPIIRETAQALSLKVHRYHVMLVEGLIAGGYCQPIADVEQTARMMQQYVQGLLIYGRVFNDLEVVRRDIARGLGRLVLLKPEYLAALSLSA